MSFLTFLRNLEALFIRCILFRKHRSKNKTISLLIPFSSKDHMRRRTLRWLLAYWAHELPDAEIIIGKSRSKVFCKGEALNNAFRKSTGKVIAIIDADAYIQGGVIEHCAKRILEEEEHHLWYVPYKNLYRLTKEATNDILSSDPEDPIRLPRHLHQSFFENSADQSHYGHRYGAMLMVLPRKAIETLGCFDERFKGWGGEDVAFLRAMDTLFGKHKTMSTSIYHLWHPFIGDNYRNRRWAGQQHDSINSNLANRYHRATRRPHKMRELVDEGCCYSHTHFN